MINASCVAALELLTAVHVPIAAAYSQLRSASGPSRVPIVRHEGGRHRSRRKIAIIGKLSPRRFPPPWMGLAAPCHRPLRVFPFEQTTSTMRSRFAAYGVQGDQIHGPHSHRAKRMDRVHSSRRHRRREKTRHRPPCASGAASSIYDRQVAWNARREAQRAALNL